MDGDIRSNILNVDGGWVPEDEIGIHVEEQHDVDKEEQVGSDDELEVMLQTPPITSSPKKASTSIWSSRMENHLIHLETDVCQIRKTQSHIRDENAR